MSQVALHKPVAEPYFGAGAGSPSNWGLLLGAPFTVIDAGGDGDYTDIQTALNAIGAGLFYVISDETIDVPIQFSASYQYIVLAPGITVLPSSTFSTSGLTIPMIAMFIMGTDGVGSVSYHHQGLMGYGTLSGYDSGGTSQITNGVVMNTYTTLAQVHHLFVDGLSLRGLAVNTRANSDLPNGTALYDPPIAQRLANSYFANLYLYDPVPSNASRGIKSEGSTSGFRIINCVVDNTLAPALDYSTLYIWARTGEEHDMYIEGCVVMSNGNTGQVLEVQGASGGVAINEGITFRSCYFYSPSSSTVYAGGGGIFIDQNNSAAYASKVRNIKFINCTFHNVGITYQSTTSDFGYIRFENSVPPPQTGSITGVTTGTTAITVGTSPYTYTNSDGFDEYVDVDGGTVTDIRVDGLAVGLANGTWLLRNGGSIQVTYTAAPTMNKVGVG